MEGRGRKEGRGGRRGMGGGGGGGIEADGHRGSGKGGGGEGGVFDFCFFAVKWEGRRKAPRTLWIEMD